MLVLAAAVPGLGHAALGRWRRGIAFFLIVALSFAVGLALHGQLPSVDPERPLTILAAFTLQATGVLNLLARSQGWGAGNIRTATFEYGTTYLLTAGLMNLLLILDVYDRLRGQRQS